jgi:RNA polymerase sigma-70 factor (ECF subfamily)
MALNDRSPDWSFERYRAYLLVLARPHVGPLLHGKVSASDLVQETLLKAFQHEEQYRGHAEPERKAWLRKILANTIADAQRKFARGKRDVGLERSIAKEVERSSIRLERWLVANQTGPSTNAERKEEFLRMAEALLKLPESQRTALELRYLHDPPHSLAQIATLLQRTEKAAANLLARGLAKLRELMESGTAEEK